MARMKMDPSLSVTYRGPRHEPWWWPFWWDDLPSPESRQLMSTERGPARPLTTRLYWIGWGSRPVAASGGLR